jgi:signal transduction histidine kinase
MTPAPRPPDESQRLRVLRRYGVLDTAAEQAFDDLAHLASHICRTPIALISLVDSERTWIKARTGLGGDGWRRELSFCAHAILDPGGVLQIPDALVDSRFATNPFVMDAPWIRFYAGAPLVTPERLAIGTVCVIDTEPRSLTVDQTYALRALARQAIALLELRRVDAERLCGGIVELAERRKVERLKSEFLSVMSHELRTPLTSIRGSLGLLAGGAAGELPPKAQRMLELAGRNTDRLAALINDLLDFERIESAQIPLELATHSLRRLVEQALAANRSHALASGVPVELEADVRDAQVHVDAVRLIQVLGSLLSNAVKFSAPGKAVRVTIHPRAAEVRVSVRDEGPGVPAEFHARVFQRFSQADGSDGRRKGGAGLRLAMSKALIERMQGAIGFESPPGAGATFWIELPVARRETPRDAATRK